MATDATGVPTSPDNLPTLNTSADAPSGLGINAMMAAVQTALNNKPGRLTATTVAGLGAGVDGQAAHLRVGAGAATDYVHLVYDSSLAKWVSPPFNVFGGYSSWNSTDGATSETRQVFGGAGQVGVGEAAIRWKPFTDAGLRLQVRITGRLFGSASGTPASTQAFIAVNEVSVANNISTVATSQITGSLVDIAGGTSSTFIGVDSGWSSSAPAATKDIGLLDLMFLTGIAQTIRFAGQVTGRWVG